MKGIYAATATPLHEDLRIDHEELAWHCSDLIQRGCAGIALFGTTGEGPSFSLGRRIEALEILTRSVNPDRIIVANGSSGVQDTVELCNAALKYGCKAVLLSPPSYFKNIREEGAIAYYREILKQVSLPTLLYHYPKLTGVPITMPILSALHREFPQTVVGLKESEGDLAFTKAILSSFPDFQVFVGKELQIAEAVRSGGAGAICGLANLYPELIRAFYEQPDPSHLEQLESISKSFREVPFNAAVKAVLQMRRGVPWRTLIPPLVPLSFFETLTIKNNLSL